MPFDVHFNPLIIALNIVLQLVCDEWANYLTQKSSILFDGYTVKIGSSQELPPIPMALEANIIKVTGLKAGFDVVGSLSTSAQKFCAAS